MVASWASDNILRPQAVGARWIPAPASFRFVPTVYDKIFEVGRQSSALEKIVW